MMNSSVSLQKKKEKRKVRFTKILLYILISIGVLLLIACLSLFIYLTKTVDPDADDALFAAAEGSRTTRLLSRSHTPLSGRCQAEELWEEACLGGGERMLWAELDSIPPLLQNAFLAVEDRSFYRHDGVDFLRTARAALNSVLRFEKRFGASTVTQQTVKNLTGDNAPDFLRKIREIYRALALEKRRSKEEILEMYLNIIPFTDGCIGVLSASRSYFGKELSALSPAETASLVAVTNAPATYDPRRNTDAHLTRRDLVLRQMYDCGVITESEYQAAVATPLQLVPREENSVHSWYTETLLSDLIEDLSRERGMSRETASRLLYSGGLTVYTAMDTSLQSTLEKYFEDLSTANGVTYAMTVIDPYTGDLLATVGRQGEKTANRIMNYARDVRRPPGSALKPLALYAPALEKGLATWATVFDDTPVTFEKQGSQTRLWPQNAGRSYSGLISFADALAESKNTVAVRLYDRIGSEGVYRALTEDYGLSGIIRRKTDENGRILTDMSAAPLALGQLTEGVTLRELCAAYTAFSDGGMRHAARSYYRVLDRNGELLLENTPIRTRALSAENAAVMTEMLRRTVESGTGRHARFSDAIPLAGKTGTAGKGEDRWFVGYTPYLLAGIYCGFSDRAQTPSGDFKTHLSVYRDVMSRLHSTLLGDAPPRRRFRIPVGVTEAVYCLDSGECPTDTCALDLRGDRSAVGYFVRGTEPTHDCARHIPILYDGAGGVATQYCLRAAEESGTHQLKKAALVLYTDRRFPVEVAVRDAEYMLRPIGDAPLSYAPNAPFFRHALEDTLFIGITAGTGEPQKNALCPLHRGESPESAEEQLPLPAPDDPLPRPQTPPADGDPSAVPWPPFLSKREGASSEAPSPMPHAETTPSGEKPPPTPQRKNRHPLTERFRRYRRGA